MRLHGSIKAILENTLNTEEIKYLEIEKQNKINQYLLIFLY